MSIAWLGAIVVLLVLAIPLVAIMLPVFIILAVGWASRGSRTSRTVREEEAKLVQEIHDGLERMGERVESLETILAEQTKKGAHL
jgi:phage shock protein B